MTATIDEAAAIDLRFTQKMGGCQRLKNPLQGSIHMSSTLITSTGEVSGSEPKGEIR